MRKIVLDKELLIYKYTVENKTKAEIAKELGVSHSVVWKNFKEYGIPTKPAYKELIDKTVLIELYLVQKFSIRKISSILKVDSNQVRKSLKAHNIPRRNKSWKSPATKNGREVPCNTCGKLVYRKNYKLNKFTVFFCSWKCAKEYQSLHRDNSLPEGWRRFREYRKWRNDVLNRDERTCKLCGSNKRLVAHHIIEAQDDMSLKYEVSNGITLCQICHIEIHVNGSHNYIESLQKAISVE